ncbi:DUF2188 domain-containing protein [Agromyces sp. SYSU K20354]|uniref:DUF2188 domain-containing protein n=1 Tax=Agromyces cavernae TaxID=2898659 RepID=UPI001E659AAB|nr:DUF2188 domain-containing protein [Agromyces cavernae]MCD2443039.1 DUF2188 domain-containing protein [Agromyces cavernae]
MDASAFRTVQPAHFPFGSWVVRSSPTGPVLVTERTQEGAISAARADLAANGGGQVAVYGRDGTEQQRLTVKPAAVAGQPVSGADLLDAAGAAGARVRGEVFDGDGDGEADGDGTLNRLVELGPDGPAKDAIRQARQLLAWLTAALALFPLLPASVMSAELGGGFAGIFLGTLAWSLGVAIIAYAVIAHPSVRSTVGLSLVGLAAFWVSNGLAGLFGGTVLTVAAPLPTDPGPTGIFTWIVDIGAAAIANYGFLGFVIGTVLGGIVGWRGAELYERLHP